MLTNKKLFKLKQVQATTHKIFTLSELKAERACQQFKGRKVVFTNGCFDILHAGHILSLNQAATQGDFLIVAVNSDASVKKLKGPSRPINNEQARATLLASLIMTDAVIIFEEDTPLQLITELSPDVLVKGGDYTIEQVVGAKEVLAAGGRVEIIPLLPGYSTTGIIEQMRKPMNNE